MQTNWAVLPTQSDRLVPALPVERRLTKAFIILNPIAGQGNAARLWQALEPGLHAGGLAFDLARTTRPHEAATWAEHAVQSGYAMVLAVGGDGTINEIVNGMMRAANAVSACTLGVIPLGSGNDFIKTLKLGHDWRVSVQHILAGATRWVDVGQAVCDQPAPGFTREFYFVNSLNLGFGAHAALHAHDFTFLTGLPMYLAAVFKTLVRYSVPRVQVDLDGRHLTQTSTMISVSNGRWIGGGFMIAPEACNDDGLFDVIIGDGLNRRGILSLLPKVMRGTHLTDPRVKFSRAAHIVIESPDALVIEADGEIPFLNAHRVEIQVLPKRLRVIV